MSLRVRAKGNKLRPVPRYADVAAALDAWREQREQIPELTNDKLLFPWLGVRCRDGSFPDAGGPLSTTLALNGTSLLPFTNP